MVIRKEFRGMLQSFELEEVEERVGVLFENCLNHINNGREEHISIKVQIGFGKDDRIAAFADKTRGGEYIIEVNMSSYFIIYSFCHCIVLQEIYPIITYNDSEDKRGFYAELLTAIMLDILLYHEIGHIVNGHIDYIKDREKESNIINDLPYAFSYVGKKARPFISPEEWQALEWNADDFSASRIVEKYLSSDTIKKLRLQGPQQAVAIIVSSYTALYTLMEMGVRCENAEEYKSFEHLPKRIRLEKSLASVYDYFNSFKLYRIGKESKEYLEYYKKIFERWTGLFLKNYFLDYDSIQIDENNNLEELDDEHREYYKRVENYYLMNLPLILDKYAKIVICDPASMGKGALLNMIQKLHEDIDINDMEIGIIKDGQIIDIQ